MLSIKYFLLLVTSAFIFFYLINRFVIFWNKKIGKSIRVLELSELIFYAVLIANFFTYLFHGSMPQNCSSYWNIVFISLFISIGLIYLFLFKLFDSVHWFMKTLFAIHIFLFALMIINDFNKELDTKERRAYISYLVCKKSESIGKIKRFYIKGSLTEKCEDEQLRKIEIKEKLYKQLKSGDHLKVVEYEGFFGVCWRDLD